MGKLLQIYLSLCYDHNSYGSVYDFNSWYYAMDRASSVAILNNMPMLLLTWFQTIHFISCSSNIRFGYKWHTLHTPTDLCGPVCEIHCDFGNVLDQLGCPTCKCKPHPCTVSSYLFAILIPSTHVDVFIISYTKFTVLCFSKSNKNILMVRTVTNDQ